MCEAYQMFSHRNSIVIDLTTSIYGPLYVFVYKNVDNEKKFYSDGQQFHQYQQHKQSPLTLTH